MGRVIDIDKLCTDLMERWDIADKQKEELVKQVMADIVTPIVVSQPIIELEIVRCKDCKWFHDIGCAIRIVDDSDKPLENDYCSFAERRTDDKTNKGSSC